ncbi:MAG TPA: hypothetical protein VI520_06175 [Anaerolineales bacterium]|nr:hypothetical protein [Anaerolineales bacterium]
MRLSAVLPTMVCLAAVVLAGCQSALPDPRPTHSDDTPRPSETRTNPAQTGGPSTDQPQTGGPPAEPSGSIHGPVFIDQAELLIRESFPIQVDLRLSGSLPTPCATLGWSVADPDEQGRIEVEAYSSQDAALACIQVLQEFEETIPLGAYSTGSYSVWLNGERIGEFEP